MISGEGENHNFSDTRHSFKDNKQKIDLHLKQQGGLIEGM